MNYAFHLLKAASLMLLVADLLGCAGQQSGSMTSNVSEVVHKGMQGVTDLVRPIFEKGQVRNVDQYCDSLEESYEVTDNVIRILSAAGLQSLQDWQKSGFKRSTKGDSDVTEVVKTVSKNYLWMPVSFEQTLGNQLHERQEGANKI